jgi:hypothetical protein
MRVVELSDHPGDLLKQARRRREADANREQRRFEDEVTQHRQRVGRAVEARDQARARRRWGAWLRGIFAVRRERRLTPQAPRPMSLPIAREEALRAGVEGEQRAEAELGQALGDEWTLIRGYRNRRGEIDHLLVGPRGLFAIEGKHHNATVYCDGDRWWSIKTDKYGNRVPGGGEITDKRGRSPSEQLNEPAGQLEDFLRSRGQPIAIERVVLFTHPRSRLGSCTRPTVNVATSTSQVVGLLNASQTVIAADECDRLERLIVRDHRYHQNRRST